MGPLNIETTDLDTPTKEVGPAPRVVIVSCVRTMWKIPSRSKQVEVNSTPNGIATHVGLITSRHALHVPLHVDNLFVAVPNGLIGPDALVMIPQLYLDMHHWKKMLVRAEMQRGLRVEC